MRQNLTGFFNEFKRSSFIISIVLFHVALLSAQSFQPLASESSVSFQCTDTLHHSITRTAPDIYLQEGFIQHQITLHDLFEDWSAGEVSFFLLQEGQLIRSTRSTKHDGLFDLVLDGNETMPESDLYFLESTESTGSTELEFIVEHPSGTSDTLLIPVHYKKNSNWLSENDFDEAGFILSGDEDVKFIAPIGDINGDGHSDLLLEQGFDEDAGYYVNLVYGSSLEQVSDQSTSTFLEGSTRIYLGSNKVLLEALPLGDINNDGFDDFGIGTLQDGGFETGYPSLEKNGFDRMSIFYGSADPLGIVEIDAIEEGAGFTIYAHEDHILGPTFTAAGDLNGDGFADLAFQSVGSIPYNFDWDVLCPHTTFTEPEEVGLFSSVILYGRSEFQTIRIDTLDSFSAVVYTDDYFSNFGQSITAGDFNGDGYADLAIGAPLSGLSDVCDGNYEAGSVFVVYGKTEKYDSLKIEASLFGTENGNSSGIAGRVTGEEFGTAIVAADYNNDGYDDLLVASPHFNADYDNSTNPSGRLNLFLGSQDSILTESALAREGFKSVFFNRIGTNKLGIGMDDINQDGYADILYSRFGSVNTNRGLNLEISMDTSERSSVYRIDLNISGMYRIGDFDGNGSEDWILTGDGKYYWLVNPFPTWENAAPTLASAALKIHVLEKGFGTWSLPLDQIYHDTEQDSISVSITHDSFQVSNGHLLFSEQGSGNFNTAITISDSFNNAVTDTIRIVINELPEFLYKDQLILQQGFGSQLVDLDTIFSDPEGNSLQYIFCHSDSLVQMTQDKNLVTISEISFGSMDWIVSAIDPLGGVLMDTIKFQVNRPPKIINTINGILQQGFEFYSQSLDSLYVDPDLDPMTYRVIDQDTILSVTITNDEIQLRENSYGESQFIIEISDSNEGITYDTIEVFINSPPVLISSFDNLELMEGFDEHHQKLSDFFSDPDSTMLHYEVEDTSKLVGLLINNDTLTFNEINTGSALVGINVTDFHGGTLSHEFLLIIDKVLGLRTDHQVGFFPNPTRDFITLKNLRSQDYGLALFDMNGNEIPITGVEDKIDVSGLPSGIYILIIETKQAVHHLKMIRE